MSSTSRTRRPAASSHAYAPRTFSARSFAVSRCCVRFVAHLAQQAAARQARFVGERFGEQQRLVVPARPKPLGGNRHRHDAVIRLRLVQDPRHLPGERRGKARLALEFEAPERRAEGLPVPHRRGAAFERVALPPHPQREVAVHALGGPCGAIRAQKVRVDRRVAPAEQAARREEKGEDTVQKITHCTSPFSGTSSVKKRIRPEKRRVFRSFATMSAIALRRPTRISSFFARVMPVYSRFL